MQYAQNPTTGTRQPPLPLHPGHHDRLDPQLAASPAHSHHPQDLPTRGAVGGRVRQQTLEALEVQGNKQDHLSVQEVCGHRWLVQESALPHLLHGPLLLQHALPVRVGTGGQAQEGDHLRPFERTGRPEVPPGTGWQQLHHDPRRVCQLGTHVGQEQLRKTAEQGLRVSAPGNRRQLRDHQEELVRGAAAEERGRKVRNRLQPFLPARSHQADRKNQKTQSPPHPEVPSLHLPC